jgi:hypothetical protein
MQTPVKNQNRVNQNTLITPKYSVVGKLRIKKHNVVPRNNFMSPEQNQNSSGISLNNIQQYATTVAKPGHVKRVSILEGKNLIKKFNALPVHNKSSSLQIDALAESRVKIKLKT